MLTCYQNTKKKNVSGYSHEELGMQALHEVLLKRLKMTGYPEHNIILKILHNFICESESKC